MYLLSEVIRKRFGIHRGIESPYALPNSLDAIKNAISLNPIFVEFDVILDNGSIKTAHPPQEPLDNLEEVLTLFKESNTFPKIDLKLKENSYTILIDKVIDLVKKTNEFTLINLSGIKIRDKMMQAEIYFASKIRDNPNIRLNLDLARYGRPRQKIDEIIQNHVKELKNTVYSISLEINEENWEAIFKFANHHGIKKCFFWLRGWPDVPNPKVKVKTILKALNLEKKYNIEIYFDINLNYIKGLKMNHYFCSPDSN